MLTENKAEIIGLLCAEGNYYDRRISYLQYDKNRKKSYYRKNKRCVYIQFSNHDPRLLKRFKFLMEIKYKYSPNINKDRIRICNREVIRELISYSNYGCLNWRASSDFLNNKKLICRFLHGYFEGDGHFSNKKIVFSSSNIIGLKQVKVLLNKLDINTTLQGPFIRENKKNSYHLYIKRKSTNKFSKFVQPIFKIPKDNN